MPLLTKEQLARAIQKHAPEAIKLGFDFDVRELTEEKLLTESLDDLSEFLSEIIYFIQDNR